MSGDAKNKGRPRKVDARRERVNFRTTSEYTTLLDDLSINFGLSKTEIFEEALKYYHNYRTYNK